MQIENSDDFDPKPNPQINYEGIYPPDQLEKVRTQLIHDIYENTDLHLSETRLIAKRKCGLFSQEVINFFRHNIKPPDLKEICEEDTILKESELTIDDRLTGVIPNQKDHLSMPISPNRTKEEIKPHNSNTESKPTPQAVERSLGINATNLLCQSLKMSHGCIDEEFRFCPREILTDSMASNKTVVFICDSCQVTLLSRESMKNHLEKQKHLSASEYFIERHGSDSVTSQTKIQGVKSRCSLINTKNPSDFAVFCPKCHFCFNMNIATCCLHYKLAHNSDEFIYSISKLKKIEKIIIKKVHSCFECSLKFKKLSDLSYHLENAKHLNKNPNSELVVLNCPIEDCNFRTVQFFTFKQHLLSHSYFRSNESLNDATSNELSIPVMVHVYDKPTQIFHICPFTDTLLDLSDELKCVESLMDFLKGHNDYLDAAKKLKSRKDYLIKILHNAPVQNDH